MTYSINLHYRAHDRLEVVDVSGPCVRVGDASIFFKDTAPLLDLASKILAHVSSREAENDEE